MSNFNFVLTHFEKFNQLIFLLLDTKKIPGKMQTRTRSLLRPDEGQTAPGKY